jgi:hypothetical protein
MFDTERALSETAGLKAALDELSARAEALKMDVLTAAEKTGKVIKALTNRFNDGEILTLSERVSGVEAGGTTNETTSSRVALGAPTSSSVRLLAEYHHFKTNRYVVGRTVAEEERLTERHGFNTVAYFNSEEEMKTWLRACNPVISPSPTNPGDDLASPQPPSRGSAAKILELTSLVEDLWAQVVELKRSMASGQGVHAGGETFDSEDDLIVLMRKEGVNPKHLIGAAVDFVSFFAHKKDGRIDDSKLSLEMKQMKMAGVDKIASLCYIGAFRHKQPSHLLNSSTRRSNMVTDFLCSKTRLHGTATPSTKVQILNLRGQSLPRPSKLIYTLNSTSLLAAFRTCACACVLMSLVGLPSSLHTLIES